MNSEIIDLICAKIHKVELQQEVNTMLLHGEYTGASRRLRQEFYFDEAVVVVELSAARESSVFSTSLSNRFLPFLEFGLKIIDFQKVLWDSPSVELEGQIQASDVTFSCELEAGVSKPLLLRNKMGAWFIWKHETELDWAISNSSELACFEVDRGLGLDLVPLTFSKSLNGIEGICQLWLHRTEMTFLNYPQMVDPICSKKMRLLDYLTFNRDRRSTNTLVDKCNDSSTPPQIYAIDHGGAFYRRKVNSAGDLELRPPEEVLSFVGARCIEDIIPNKFIQERILRLNPRKPFPKLHGLLTDFDLDGLSERVSWLQSRI